MHGAEKDDVDAPEGNANLGVVLSADPLSFAPMFGRSFGNGVQYCVKQSALLRLHCKGPRDMDPRTYSGVARKSAGQERSPQEMHL